MAALRGKLSKGCQCPPSRRLGFLGLGFKNEGSGFRVEGLGLRVDAYPKALGPSKWDPIA